MRSILILLHPITFFLIVSNFLPISHEFKVLHKVIKRLRYFFKTKDFITRKMNMNESPLKELKFFMMVIEICSKSFKLNKICDSKYQQFYQ